MSEVPGPTLVTIASLVRDSIRNMEAATRDGERPSLATVLPAIEAILADHLRDYSGRDVALVAQGVLLGVAGCEMSRPTLSPGAGAGPLRTTVVKEVNDRDPATGLIRTVTERHYGQVDG